MALVRAVDLVDRHDRPDAAAERLGKDEFRLRHRSFGRVDQDDGAVDHAQNALDLAAEIGVTGGVDDVDARALPQERRHLGQDGNAAFTLQVIGIHRSFCYALVVAERAGLAQEHVDQRRLAVIDMGNDGDVAKRHSEPGFGGAALLPAGSHIGDEITERKQ